MNSHSPQPIFIFVPFYEHEKKKNADVVIHQRRGTVRWSVVRGNDMVLKNSRVSTVHGSWLLLEHHGVDCIKHGLLLEVCGADDTRQWNVSVQHITADGPTETVRHNV